MAEDLPSQDDIDAIFAQVAGGAASTPPSSPAPEAPLDQSDIDALLNEVQSAVGGAPIVAPPSPAALAAAAAAALNQGDIDALIAEAESKTKKPAAPARASASSATTTARAAQDDIDAILNEVKSAMGGAPPATPSKAKPAVGAAKPAADSTAGMAQTDIDQLLAELGAGAAPPRPATVTVAMADPLAATVVAPSQATTIEAPLNVPGGAQPTLSLSSEDLDALVDKQSATASDHSEAPMIDQGDIDALVKQLANATGAPDTQRISAALAQHEGEIGKLLDNGNPNLTTADAVDMGKLSPRTSPGASGMAMSHFGPGVPVLAPRELRGARWLLAAGVLLLGVCSTTLIGVVRAIDKLAQELHSDHPVEAVPTDSYADDLKTALAMLAASDEVEAAKGVVFIDRLKKRQPVHEAELALILARHHRAHGQHRNAAQEFAVVLDGAGAPDDPRIHLEYADSLSQLKDYAGATRQVYIVLANEAAYVAEKDRHGLARPADELARNRQAVQDAYLDLGRLMTSSWEQSRDTRLAKREAHAEHGGGTAHDGRAAPGGDGARAAGAQTREAGGAEGAKDAAGAEAAHGAATGPRQESTPHGAAPGEASEAGRGGALEPAAPPVAQGAAAPAPAAHEGGKE